MIFFLYEWDKLKLIRYLYWEPHVGYFYFLLSAQYGIFVIMCCVKEISNSNGINKTHSNY